MPLISYISIPHLHPWDGHVLRYDRYALTATAKNDKATPFQLILPNTTNQEPQPMGPEMQTPLSEHMAS
jgi:hypothetical protein